MLKLTGEVGAKTLPESKITFVQKVIKGETWMVMAHSAVELEDEWANLYYTAGQQNNLFLMPPFEPNVLLNLVQTNNILNQCIEAMEVNIDGTGYDLVPVEDGKDIDTSEEAIAIAFFNEPYPNISMTAIRRKLRRQMESVGYGFVEVLRNVAGDIVGLRSVETAHVRMVKLDAPIQVQKKVERDGKEVELTLWERERRFAQTVALKQQVYYREYGTTREVHRDTGDWETPEVKVPPEKRGSELLMFGINPDVTTPYFLPRWINQLPSVIGSRAAEEQNLQFLDAGGLPPAIVFIQGGTLIKDTSDQLRMYLSGMNKNKNRAVVVEVQSSSGSLDAAGKVDVKVERFGCICQESEVLTSVGWIPIKNWQGQAVATEVHGALQYQQPLAYHKYQHKGTMLHIEGNATEFCITLNHRVWYEATHDHRRRFEMASDTFQRSNVRIPVSSTWGMTGEFPANPVIGGATYPWPEFLDFLGMFIADGSTMANTPAEMVMKVKKSRKVEFIDSFAEIIAKSSGGTWSRCVDTTEGVHEGYTNYRWRSQELRDWLRQEVGPKANVKRLPSLCWSLPQPWAERLLLALMQGDGHYNGENDKHGWTYTTTSLGLADDIQRLCLHAGYRSVNTPVKREYVDGHSQEWCISITPKTIAHVTKGKCPTWELTQYEGQVYCFTMPSGVFVTRRNGKICITGNSAQSQDSMYTNYDEVTKEHVRIGFRLPPLFLGYAADYNFATAQTSYMVAEAQVFEPERTEFDEVINKTVVKELKLKTLLYKSKPITLKDVATQLKGLELSMPVATRESFLKEMNTIATMNLEMAEVPAPNVAPGEQPLKHTPTMDEIPSGELPVTAQTPMMTAPQKEPEPKVETPNEIGAKEEAKAMAREKAKAKYRKAASDLLELAQDYAQIYNLVPHLARKQEITDEREAEVEQEVDQLTPDDAKAFNHLLAMYVFGSDAGDLSSIIAANR